MKIFSNLAVSLDGKIATMGREAFPLGSKRDLAQMGVLRRRSDVILMGASTLRTWKKPLRAPGRKDNPPANAIISSRLDGISPTWPFFKDRSIRRIVFVSRSAPKSRIARFAKHCELRYLHTGAGAPPIAAQIVSALGKDGYRRLLVEGGGGVMWNFASLNLIDEYHVTLTPRILGGTEAPTLVDGPGFPPSRALNLKLASARRVGDELFLVYRKTSRRGR